MGNDAKVTRPDLETPTGELRKEAYELALSVWEMAPWLDLIEEQLLAIRFKDGTARFLSVMGSNGEHRAIALYPNAATYWRIRGIDNDDNDDLLDAFLSTNHLQLYFCKAPKRLKHQTTARRTGLQSSTLFSGNCATSLSAPKHSPRQAARWRQSYRAFAIPTSSGQRSSPAPPATPPRPCSGNFQAKCSGCSAMMSLTGQTAERKWAKLPNGNGRIFIEA